jgi:hypothetical protein
VGLKAWRYYPLDRKVPYAAGILALDNSTILVAGGHTGDEDKPIGDASVFTIRTRSFQEVKSMIKARSSFAMVLLNG